MERNLNLSEQIFWGKDSFGPDSQIKLEQCKYFDSIWKNLNGFNAGFKSLW